MLAKFKPWRTGKCMRWHMTTNSVAIKAKPKDAIDNKDLTHVHVPVLKREVEEIFKACTHTPTTLLDGTFGLGGHTSHLLTHIPSLELVVGIDRDLEALQLAAHRMSIEHDDLAIELHTTNSVKHYGTGTRRKLALVHEKFSASVDAMRHVGVKSTDLFLLDIGLSSLQLDSPRRGFSFSKLGPLDMRMNASAGEVTALQLIQKLTEKDLADILYENADERFSRRIARNIMTAFARGELKTTSDLEAICWSAYPTSHRHTSAHPATRTFQALRIVVNDEIKELQEVLEKAPKLLRTNGRLCVISFHSIEDRVVKHTFKAWKSLGLATDVSKRPLTAQPDEIKSNVRSRSAKLRACTRYQIPNT